MTASGGTAPYTYTLTIDGTQVATGAGTSFSWNTIGYANGSHTLGLTVRDNVGATATASRAVTIQNGTTPPPLTASFAAPAAGATVTGTVGVTMAASGGTAPYTYTLSVDGAQVASSAATTYSWNTTAASNGAHTLGLTVRDSTGATATSSRTVSVQNGGGTLSVAITTPSPGQTVSGTVWVTIWVDGAAAGSKTYTLTANGTTVWNEATANRPASLPWVTTNGPNGTQTLVVSVVDASGATGSGSITVTVQNGTAPPPALAAGFSSPAAGATVGNTVSVGMTGSGGTAPYTYTLTIDGTQVATGAATSFSWNTTTYANGSHTLGLTVRDNVGATATASRAVTVQNSTTPPPLSASFTAPAAGATVSGTVGVSMAASGGTAPYTYTLTIDGAQVATGAAATYSWNTTAATNAGHTLGLTVRDRAGVTATASRTVTVQNGGGGTLSVAITTPSPGATVRGTVWVTIWVDGAAAGNKTYTLTVGGTTVWNEANANRPATLPWVTTNGPNGTQTLVVTVRDSAGATGTGSITVTVSNP
jgi:hypothetical protein